MNMSPQERYEMRLRQVEECLASGMSIKAWAKLNRISVSTMYVWIRRFRRENPEMFEDRSTNEWIEIARNHVKATTALVKTSDQNAEVVESQTRQRDNRGLSDDHGAVSSIVVTLNGANVVVPPGFSAKDLTCVLQAVAAL